ncbi:MAG: imidazolonepropionase [Rhodothermales bacterium]
MMHCATGIRRLVTCAGDGLGLIEDAALVWEDDRLVWVGPAENLPESYQASDLVQHDLGAELVVPGLVDAHTHLAFGGWRSDEFALRCEGATYQAIARAGGGIASTMQKTRALDEDALYDRARGFLAEMLRLGVTTVEAKSGYGLTVADELKLLRVYDRLRREGPQTLVATCLAAHVVSPEYRDDRAGYVDLICDTVLPRVAKEKLAAFCDVFVEDGAFTPDEARTILNAGQALGLRPKLHVDQLHDGGGAALAAEVGAISADHLEYTSDAGIAAMAEAGVIAVTLPLASLYLRQPPLDARRFLESGVPVAVATDFNPGSAPSYHLPFAMTLACVMNRMTPAQALCGATIVAAQAIGLAEQVGSLEAGKRADFVCVDVPSVEHWLYHLRGNAVQRVCVGGTLLEPNVPC